MRGYAPSNGMTPIIVAIVNDRKSSKAGATVKGREPVKADGDIWTI